MQPINTHIPGSRLLAAAVASAVLLPGCTKYLDAKPDLALVTPSSYEDLRSLLDADFVMNSSWGVAAAVAGDDYYLTATDLAGMSDPVSTLDYSWDPAAQNESDWQGGYKRVFIANVVLAHWATAARGVHSGAEWNALRGEALFYRGFSLFDLAQTFTMPYNEEQATMLPGLALKQDATITSPTVRANLAATYDLIVHDLQECVALLPEEQAVLTRPSKAAAYGALARVYLAMHLYEEARLAADSFLMRHDALMDLNALDSNAYLPIRRFNAEVSFHTSMRYADALDPSICKADSSLYRSYSPDDLRRAVFFRENGDGSAAFRGDFGGSGYGALFNGIATDEVLLIRAECEARSGQTETALQDINHLLEKRFRSGSFKPIAGLPGEALAIVLRERRKELVLRGNLRWYDVRRLNAEAGFSITMRRRAGDQVYELAPNDDRYAFLLPASVVQLTGIAQNKR